MHHFDQKPITSEVLQMEWCVPFDFQLEFLGFHVNGKHLSFRIFNDTSAPAKVKGIGFPVLEILSWPFAKENCRFFPRIKPNFWND